MNESEELRGVAASSALASVLGVLCLAPESRPAIVSLLSTNAVSRVLCDLATKNAQLADILQPLEVLTFMAAGGWIFSSGFFHPESYERSYMKQILKNVVLPQVIASELQMKYRQGVNVNSCLLRHEGLSCTQFARSDFLKRVASRSLRLYAPVHMTAWLLSLRHRLVRSRPVPAQFQGVLRKVMRSSAYSIGYVYLGWMLCCALGKLGDRSLSHRKLQFFLSGTIPSLAIFCEPPARRRSIGIVLISYALVSAGSVAGRDIQWLSQAGHPARSVLETVCVAVAISITMPRYLEGNQLLQSMFLGDAKSKTELTTVKR